MGRNSAINVGRRPAAGDAEHTETAQSAPGTDLRLGFAQVAPACVAVLPLGLALGVLVIQAGLQWWWAPVLAAAVFAGSLEFLLVGLLAAVAPLSQIALTSLLVNFRHIFYAISFPLHRVHGRAAKAYSMMALTDEAYALTLRAEHERYSTARILAIQGGFHAGWVCCVTLGALLGAMIPPQVQGLDFAVTALFVVLAMDAYKIRRRIPVPLLAVACSLAAAWLVPHAMLAAAMGLFLAALTAGYLLRRRAARRQGTQAVHGA